MPHWKGGGRVAPHQQVISRHLISETGAISGIMQLLNVGLFLFEIAFCTYIVSLPRKGGCQCGYLRPATSCS